MEWNGDKQWWLGEHSIELMVPLDFIDTRPCFPQQDIFFWGYAEWSLVFKYFGTFGKIVGSASLVNSNFPRSSRTVDYSGLQAENFVLFTYILKNKAQTQIFDFSNLYKPLSISSADWMLLLCLTAQIIAVDISVTSRSRFAGRVALAFTESKSIHFHTRFAGRVAPAFTESKKIHFHTRFAGRVAPAFTESKSIHLIPHKIRCMEGSHRLLQNSNQSTSTQDSLEGSHRLLQNPNQSTSTQDSLEGSHRLLQNPNQSTSTQDSLEGSPAIQIQITESKSIHFQTNLSSWSITE